MQISNQIKKQMLATKTEFIPRSSHQQQNEKAKLEVEKLFHI